MTGLLDNLADKTENLDQCKGVASAVADLTSNPDQTSSSSRVSTKCCLLIIVNCKFIHRFTPFLIPTYCINFIFCVILDFKLVLV